MEQPPAGTVLDRLQRLIQTLGHGTDFAAFREALERPLVSALASIDVASSCADVLGRLAAEPPALAPRAAGATPASLVNASGAVRLELPPVEPKGGALAGSPSHRVFGVVSGELRVKRWRHEEPADPRVFSPDLALSTVDDCTLGTGEVLAAEAWRDVEELSGAAVVLVLRSMPCYPVMWQYDRQSLRPKSMIAATEQLARLEAALDILMRLGTAEDAEACRVLARHDFHAIRWSAVRLACNVGTSFGFELLEAATRDPHPHVRTTAEQAFAAVTAAQAG